MHIKRWILRQLALMIYVCLYTASLSLQTALAREGIGARIVHVIDGDSLVAEWEGRVLTIRLWGIDAPEWGQAFSDEAKKLCQTFVEGKTIAVQEKYRDRYDRVVAVVWVEGRLLNEDMVRQGMAWVHRRYCDEEICSDWSESEKAARGEGVGLWKDARPTAPWEWKSRKGRREQEVNSGRVTR